MVETIPEEVRDLLALHLVDGLGPQRIAALLEHFGSAGRARRAGAGELRQVSGIGEQLSANLARALPGVDVEAELERIRQMGARLLVRGQPDYPPRLESIPSAPVALYVQGAIEPADDRAVAMVGTRHPDAYGKRVARMLAEGLARAGVTVVSGLARGVDGIAHQAALDAGGRTLAVLGGGLGRLYPPEHRNLAEAITRSGAVLTESSVDQSPSKWSFPARNRIISGLSRLVVIVQAPSDSGALITAEHAAEQGRTVLAVPGPVDAAPHSGCHRLLREGAILCRGVEDILEELDGVSAVATRERSAARAESVAKAEPAPPAGPPPGLDEVQHRVWEFLGPGARAGDEIAQGLNLPASTLSGVLLGLELKRVIRRLPGNRYERS